MKNKEINKEQLVDELGKLRRRVDELEAVETKHVQYEEELREQQQIFKSIITATPDLIVLKDREFVYKAVNQAFCGFLGRNEEEIIGRTDFDLFPREEAEMYRRDDASVMEDCKPQVQDEEVTGVEGKKWLQVFKTPVFDEYGVVSGILCSVRDISQRKHAEEELNKYREYLEEIVEERTAELRTLNQRLQDEINERKRKEEQLQEQNKFIKNALESISHPFYVIDADDYTVKMANSAARARYGDLSNNVKCHEYTHRNSEPCGKSGEVCPLEEVKENNKAVTVEHTHYDKDNNARIFEVHGHPVFDRDGNIIQMIEFTLDITERKKAQEIVYNLKELNENVIQSIQEGLVALDGGFRITLWNRAMEEISGYKEEEVVGRVAFDVFPHLKEQAVDELFKIALEGRVGGRPNVPFETTKGKTGYTNERCLPLKDMEGNVVGVLMIVEDVTEALRKEQELALLQEEIKQRKLVEVAKGILMRELGLSEDGAYQFIQKKSQDESKKMADIARRTIEFFGTTKDQKKI